MDKYTFCKNYNITASQFVGGNKIGGWLDLSSLTNIPDGFNPTVGGSLDLRRGHNIKTHKPPTILIWEEGKYCLADGIFGEVISRRNCDDIEVWKVRKVNKKETFYLVKQNNLTSHGSNIKEAIIDLRFKAESRDKSDYKDLTLESEISFEDAVICYRVITGACSFGVSDFLKNRLRTKKDRYKVREIIELTNGEYRNNTFSQFFQA